MNHVKHCQNDFNEKVNNLKEKNNSENKENFVPSKINIKIIKGQIKKDELNNPYIEYIIDINYDIKKKYQIYKQFYHFSNLYNNLINLYSDYIQFPLSFVNIFQNTISDSFLNKNKTQILQKFINEVAQTDVINTSKSFLKFIEFDKYLRKSFKLNSCNINDMHFNEKNNLNFKGKKFDNKINNEEDNYQIKENIANNRYINRFNINNKENKSKNSSYNIKFDDKNNIMNDE